MLYINMYKCYRENIHIYIFTHTYVPRGSYCSEKFFSYSYFMATQHSHDPWLYICYLNCL